MSRQRKDVYVPVPFIPAQRTESDEDKRESDEEAKTSDVGVGVGDDIKSFYEGVVGLTEQPRFDMTKDSANPPSKSSTKICDKRKECRKKGKGLKKPSVTDGSEAGSFKSTGMWSTDRSLHLYLKTAQMGDVDEMREWINRGVDIEAQDQFGWTALMCAIQEENVETMTYLLEMGASVDTNNKQGISAKTMALRSRRNEVQMIMEDYLYKGTDKMCDTESTSQQTYCPSCQINYISSQAKHNASTVHLLNSKDSSAKSTVYGIPEHNTGYKMMVKSGWDRERGLGPEGQGNKFPVKTVLKRDRLGLGSSIDKSQVRVTHFGPHDDGAVKRDAKQSRQMRRGTLGKMERKKKLMTEKQKEQDFRLEFSLQ